MSKRERKARHLAAAAYLRSVTDEDEIVEVAASHLLDAYVAAPDDDEAEGIRLDALAMLRKASERAAPSAPTRRRSGTRSAPSSWPTTLADPPSSTSGRG